MGASELEGVADGSASKHVPSMPTDSNNPSLPLGTRDASQARASLMEGLPARTRASLNSARNTSGASGV